MKKHYITPSMKVIEIRPASIIATSNMAKGSGTQPISAESKFFYGVWDEDIY